MRFKVYGGTASQSVQTLCAHCRHARVVRRRRFDEEMVFCNAMSMESVRIAFRVTTCTEYMDTREPTYHDFLEKAWILTPGSKRRPAGFVPASQLSGKEALRLLRDPTESED